MSELRRGELDAFLDVSLEKATRIGQALGHLAKAVELGLVDVALDPSIANNGSREKFVLLGQKLGELSGMSYELLADLSSTTGIPIQVDEETQRTLPAQERLLVTPEPATADDAKVGEQEQAASPVRKEDDGGPTGRTVVAPAPEPSAPVKQEAASEQNDLYQRIVELSRLPEMRPVDEAEAVRSEVIADDRIRIGQQEIVLQKHELFLFNALLLLRDEPRSGRELRDLGFYPGAKSTTSSNNAFSVAMNKLTEQLNQVAKKEIIKKIGEKRATRYALNPRLVLTDVRDETLPTEAPEGVKKN